MSADSAEPSDTFTVALLDPVDLAHAPVPTNDSERLLFRQLFETLIRVDCRGELRPGLATAWSPDSTGRIWTFTLRDGAGFLDGSPVTADRLITSWRSREGMVRALGVDSAVPLDERRLAVTLRDVRDSAPMIFAEPALAASQPVDSAFLASVRIPLNGKQPVLQFVMSRAGDPRDALDGGADLVVTRDPALVDYVSARKEFETFPLPWDRTYVLFQRVGTEPIDAPIAGDSDRRSLAADAVSAEARPAESPFWWNSPCTINPSMPVQWPTSPRIVYRHGDEVARQLAERIIALAHGGVQLRAVALDSAEFAAALRKGGDRGYIVALPRQALAPCRQSTDLTAATTIQPLIDTRSRAILRRGSPELTVDWDGTVRVLGDHGVSKDLP